MLAVVQVNVPCSESTRPDAMITNRFRSQSPLTPGSLLKPAMGALAALCLAVLLAFGAVPAHAQVQIDQVENAASKIQGATEGQVIVKLQEEAGEVTRDDVLGLTGASPLPGNSGSGASAVVEQQGNSNEATVTQEGNGHEASVAQFGNRNDMSVVQGPVSGYGGSAPSYVGGGTGTDNLAVAVQDGSDNATTIQQYGSDNIAGIRLDGSGNAMELLQVGDGNEYLLDHTGSGLDLTGSKRIEQFGNNNLLRQRGAGTPISVQMRGEGIRMEITHTP